MRFFQEKAGLICLHNKKAVNLPAFLFVEDFG